MKTRSSLSQSLLERHDRGSRRVAPKRRSSVRLEFDTCEDRNLPGQTMSVFDPWLFGTLLGSVVATAVQKKSDSEHTASKRTQRTVSESITSARLLSLLPPGA